MLRIGVTAIGVADMARATRFWCAALDYVPREGHVRQDWAELVPADGSDGPRLALHPSETPVQEHPRVHLDLLAGSAADQEAEIGRLISLGAERVAWDLYPPDADFVVMADTEGNRFCVIDTGHG